MMSCLLDVPSAEGCPLCCCRCCAFPRGHPGASWSIRSPRACPSLSAWELRTFPCSRHGDTNNSGPGGARCCFSIPFLPWERALLALVSPTVACSSSRGRQGTEPPPPPRCPPGARHRGGDSARADGAAGAGPLPAAAEAACPGSRCLSHPRASQDPGQGSAGINPRSSPGSGPSWAWLRIGPLLRKHPLL